jgi:hypothetical protein
MRIFLITLIAGVIMIAIGIIAIVLMMDNFAFIRGMLLIITGIIITALGYRFKRISHL